MIYLIQEELFFVSHNMAAISSLCTKGILIKRGNLIYQGEIEDVINKYLNDDIVSSTKDLFHIKDREGTNHLKFSSFSIFNKDKKIINEIQSGQKIKISINYRMSDKIELRGVYFCLNFLVVTVNYYFNVNQISLPIILILRRK